MRGGKALRHRRPTALALALGASLCGCGGSSTPPSDGGSPGDADAGAVGSEGVGRISVGRSIVDGAVFLSFYFAPFQICSALARDDLCRVEYADTCWPEPKPGARIPNAGTISATDGSQTLSYATDKNGFYTTRTGGPLDPEAQLHIAAAGDNVPAFEADISLPHGSLEPIAPAEQAHVSRSSPVTVRWSGMTDAERAGITVAMAGSGDASHVITCQPDAQPDGFDMPIPIANALVAGVRTVLGVAPANRKTLTLKGWTIDVIANGSGAGHDIVVDP